MRHRFEWGRGSDNRELDRCGGAGPAGAAQVSGCGSAWLKEGERGGGGGRGAGGGVGPARKQMGHIATGPGKRFRNRNSVPKLISRLKKMLKENLVAEDIGKNYKKILENYRKCWKVRM
jgi:hypothetical protein